MCVYVCYRPGNISQDLYASSPNLLWSSREGLYDVARGKIADTDGGVIAIRVRYRWLGELLLIGRTVVSLVPA